MAKSATPPKITTVQLNLSGVGLGVPGKHSIAMPRVKKDSARMLTAMPARPRFQRGGWIGWAEKRFARRQAMETQ